MDDRPLSDRDLPLERLRRNSPHSLRRTFHGAAVRVREIPAATTPGSLDVLVLREVTILLPERFDNVHRQRSLRRNFESVRQPKKQRTPMKAYIVTTGAAFGLLALPTLTGLHCFRTLPPLGEGVSISCGGQGWSWSLSSGRRRSRLFLTISCAAC